MFIYTLVMLILPSQGGLEYSIQHFNSPEECRELLWLEGGRGPKSLNRPL